MDPRPPERLVDIDVPQARERALVEQRRLDRRLPLLQPLAEAREREERVERLAAATSSGSYGRVSRASEIVATCNLRPESTGSRRRRTVSTSGSSGIGPG